MAAGEIKFVVTVDSKGAVTGIKKVTGATDDLEKQSKKTGDSITSMAKRAAAALSIYAIGRGLTSIAKASIDATETTSKFGVVFRDEISRANEVSRELVDSYGFSATGAEQALSSVSDLAQGLGIASDESLRMAETTTKFSADLVSFTNVTGGVERAVQALTSAQLGEREALKAYGIAIHEADVQQRLLLKGQQNLEGSALKAAKAQAVLELAMEQSKNAVGDFARTAESPANMLRILQSRIEDFRVGLGDAITKQTSFKDGISAINDVLSDKNLQDGLASIIGSVAKLASILINATAGLIDFITQTSNLKLLDQAAEQTENLTAHMRRQEQAIADAGISIDRYHEAIKKTPQFQEILDLTDAIEKQKQKIEETKEKYKGSIFDPTRASLVGAEVNKLNELIRNQTELQVEANREITKNASAYDITTRETEKYRKSLQGSLKETEKQVELEKEKAKLIPKATKVIETQAEIIKRIGEEMEAAHDETIDFDDSIKELSKELDTQAEISNDVIEGLKGTEEGYENNVSAAEMVEREIREYNERLQESINFMFTFVGKILDFVGVSGQAVDGLQSLVGGFMQLTSGDILGGISSLVDGLFDLIGGLFGAKEETKKLGEEFVNAKGIVDTIRGTEEFWESYSEQIENLTEFLKIGAENQEQFNDQSNIALGQFAALINSGKSYAEALRIMQEPLGLLSDSMAEFGFEGSETFNMLLDMQRKVAENEQLISSIDAFNQMLIASRNLIGDNEEQFTAYTGQTLTNYDKLLEADFTQREALLLTAPALQQLQELQQKYGFAVDETTQKLIDEADSLGLFQTDPFDRIVEVLELIAIHLGAIIPEAAETGAEKTGKAFDDLAKRAIRDFEDMATAAGQVMVPVDTRQTGTRTQPPLLPPSNTPGFADGGGGIIPPGFNNDDFFLRASSGEEISINPRNNRGNGGGGGDTMSIVINYAPTFYTPISPQAVTDNFLQGVRQGLNKDEIKRELA